MGRNPLSPTSKGMVRTYLSLNYSTSMVMKEMAAKKRRVSHGMICKLRKEASEDTGVIKIKKKKKGNKHVFKKMTRKGLRSLIRWTSKTNPPTQKWMSNQLNVSERCIRHHIKRTLKKKKEKKTKVHYLSDVNIRNRKTRALPLYKRLRKFQYMSYITTDEAWFYLSDGKGDSEYEYRKIRMSTGRQSICRRKTRHSKGFMAWAGVSSNGKTGLIWVDPGAKVNSDYYQYQIIIPFLEKDAFRLYPDGNFVLHQDSAPAHVSKATIQFLDMLGVNYIPKDEWMPASPDAAPMDFCIWGYMKQKLSQMRIKNISQLKPAVERVWSELSQSVIDRELAAWPKRCKLIHQNRGHQIEQIRTKKTKK